MRLRRVTFMHQVQTPEFADETLLQLRTELGPGLHLEKVGDLVRAVHEESGREQVYPWGWVRQAEPLREIAPAPTVLTAPAPEVTDSTAESPRKRNKKQ